MGQWAGRGRGEGKRGPRGQAGRWPGKVLVSWEEQGCLEQEPCSVLCMLVPYTGFHPHESRRGHTGVATGHLCPVRTRGDRVKASPTLTPLRQQCLGLHPGLRAPSHTFSGSGGPQGIPPLSSGRGPAGLRPRPLAGPCLPAGAQPASGPSRGPRRFCRGGGGAGPA